MMDMQGQPRQSALPSDPELEKALLGAILVNNDAYLTASKIIGPEAFADDLHAAIFDAAGEMIGKGGVFDPHTAKSVIKQFCGERDPSEILASLAMEAGPAAAVTTYAQVLADLHAKGRLALLCDKAFGQAMNGAAPLDVAALLEEEVALVRDMLRPAAASGMRGAGQAFVNRLGEAWQRQCVDGVPWPLEEVQTVMGGPMEPGNLYGFLAASGEGKTSITLQIARHAAEQGHPTLLISYDQTAWQCIRQMAAQALNIEVEAMNEGKLSEAQFDAIVEETQRITALPMEVTKIARGKVATVMNIARSFVRRRKNGKHPLIIIDHIKRIDQEDTRDDAGTRVNRITSALKGMSEEIACATLLLNQRNSAGLRRSNPSPSDEDLFGGAGAKEDYDAILTLYRAEMWLKVKLRHAERENEKETIRKRLDRSLNMAEFSTIKNRYGEPGRVQEVRFVARFTRFESMRDKDEGLFGA